MREPLLEIADVSKTFAGQRALSKVSLEVRAGEVMAIVGQNGSGKSTLIKTLAGFHDPDPGGKIVARGDLHFIHQDLALVGGLSTVENLALNRGTGAGAFRPHERRRAEEARAKALLARFGASHDVRAPIDRLSRAEQTVVAIARALDAWTSDLNIIVLDEPTASLHREESIKLFKAVRHLVAGGAGVLFVSHRLDEVVELADRVTVLRDGQVVRRLERDGYSQTELIRSMTGADVDAPVREKRTLSGGTALDVRGLAGDRVHNLDLRVRAGEIVGITGLVGSGSEHVASLVFGAQVRSGGAVSVFGRALPPGRPTAAIKAGLGFVPADRPAQGALLPMTVAENLTLADLGSLTGWGRRLSGRSEQRHARTWIARVDVRPAEPERLVGLLSGGNQQKVVLAKWLRLQPRVLLLDEPTQGVDVAAKAALHRLILGAAEAGAGVLICSTDTQELVDLCDRVLVLRDGHAAADLSRDRISQERLTRESFDLAGGSDPRAAMTTAGGTGE
jgi:ribose transport system ATP-binding protein